MSYATLRRYLTVGVLAAALGAAGAAPASARDLGTAGVDPSGATSPPPSSATPPCGSSCPDEGFGLDPNG